MTKFFKKKVIIPLIALPVVATTLGVGIYFGKNAPNSNSSNQATNEIKTILASSNSDVPTDLKQYLLSVVNDIDKNKQIDIKQVADTLKKWAQINDYLGKIKKTNFSENYTNFLQQSLNLNVSEIESQKNSLAKDIDKKDASGLNQLISKSDEIKQIEHSLFNFYTTGTKSEQDYNQIQGVLTNLNTVLTESSRKQLEMNLVNDFVKNQNLKGFLNKIQKIDSVAQTIDTKNGKIDISDLASSDPKNQNLSELKDLVDDLDLKSSHQLAKIEDSRNDAKSKIDNLKSLSLDLKTAFKNKINATDDGTIMTNIVGQASAYDTTASELIDAIQMAKNVKETSQYTSATDKSAFDTAFEKAQAVLSLDSKLALNQDYLNSSSQIATLTTLITDLKTAVAALNGQTSDKSVADFKSDVENKLNVSFYKGVNTYGLKNLIYSVSIDNETKPLLLTENSIDDVKLTFLSSELDNSNINKVHLFYQAEKISNPSVTAKVEKTMTFDTNFNNVINKIHFNNLDELFNFDYDRLEHYFESDVQNKKIEIESQFTNKLTNVNGFFTYKIKENSLTYGNDNKLSLIVDFFVGERQVKEIKLETNKTISFQKQGSQGDPRFGFDYDLKKVVSFIEHKNSNFNGNLDAELIWENTTIKPGATKTHSDYRVDDAIEALTNSYNFPKIGDYQIYPQRLLWPRYVNDKDYITTANVFFWIKKDGKDLDFSQIHSNVDDFNKYQNQFAKKINYFKPYYFIDVPPKNDGEWYNALDFNRGSIDPNDKSIIDKINSTNFELRKADGAIINKKAIKYSVLDPKDIIEQKAYSALNYLLKLKSTNKTNEGNNSGNLTSKDEQEAKLAAKNSKENHEFKDNKEVEDGLKDASGKIIKSKNIDLTATSSDFYTSKDNISNSKDVDNHLDISKIAKDYYIYFYDVQPVLNQPDSLSFKLGFIDKKQPIKRYTNKNNIITLTHLRNDFKYNLYPEVILNRIKLSDFTIQNNGNASSKEELEKLIKWNKDKITYNNFDFYTKDIKIADVVSKNNGVYVKFQYTDPTTKKTVIGNNYYKVSNSTSSNSSFNNKDFSFTNKNLKTIFESTNSIDRTRKIEFYFKDQSWNYDSSDQSAHWTLKEKYLDKTFFHNNPSKRKIKLTISGDALIQDDFRLSRFIDRSQIYGYKEPYTVEIDFDQLVNQKIQTVSFKTHPYSIDGKKTIPALKLNLTATLSSNNDINFKLSLDDSSYKLVVGNPYFYVLPTTTIYTDSSRYGEFDKNKAFLLNYYGAAVEISYTNAVEHEEFTTPETRTNQFNYKELDFSQENQPITFYNPESTLDPDKYNPNQNVNYELHNGYLMDQEYIHSGWKTNDLVNKARAREFAFSFGSGTELAKVSKDPHDLRFYGISNRHIVKVDHWSDLRSAAGSQGRSYFTKPSDKFQNDVNAGYSYWSGGQVGKNMKLQVIWTGIEQINKNGQATPAGKENVDTTVFSFDAKPMIDDARKWGRMELIKWFEDLAKLPDVKFNTSWEKQGISLNPDVRRYAIIGFPYGKQAGYYINRVKNGQATTSLAHVNNYVQTFYNAGNSGTGILGAGDEYIATINSGVPLTGLQGWKYDTPDYNYFGVNFDGQHPLDLKNTHSLAAEIIRRHLEEPLNYKLPWFFHNFKDQSK